ncbi:YdcF family protein [Caballeronia ptereochthonis]|uniref:DUF218 domain-containing protein n=1 Tax=Caballeronia ptereochthonis TaxID=1777144 RepID=A0A158B156_9BURK|nr:YdcF family protein [Caballeronia ptereochthonis]SAK63921.1 hypothetical protein AWB83_02637 [Caballeronia ptereochthonis]
MSQRGYVRASGEHIERMRGVFQLNRRTSALFAWASVSAVLMMGLSWVTGSGVWSVGFQSPPPHTDPAFGARNAIVLLSAGADQWESGGPYVPTYDAMFRIRRAAADYAACKADNRVCKVIISGGDPSHHGQSDAEIYTSEIEALGVGAADLILEQRSRTTYENARYVEPLLRSGNYDVVLLVTSAYHMRRAQLAFNRLGLRVIPDAARADKPVISFLPRRHNFRLAWRALHELGGIVQLRMYDWAGIH